MPGHDQHDARIRVLALDPPHAGRVQEIEGRNFAGIRGLHWAPDDRGWFVALERGIGSELLYVTKDGVGRHLLETVNSTWALPSPDNRRLAYVDSTIDSNVAMFDLN
jgi:hypothetical protein